MKPDEECYDCARSTTYIEEDALTGIPCYKPDDTENAAQAPKFIYGRQAAQKFFGNLSQ